MNICIVSPGFPTSKTIDFVFVEQLCKAIAELGNKVTIIAPQSITKSLIRKVPIVKFRSVLNVKNGNNIIIYRPMYLTYGNFKRLKKTNLNNFNKSVLNVLEKIKETPDFCYGHFWESAFSIYPYANKNRIPLFVSSGEDHITLHTNYSSEELNNFIKYVDGVISVSTKNKNEIIECGLAKVENCNVIPNSIDPSLFHIKNKSMVRKKLNVSNDDFIICFVGQFNERKGVMRLSKALESLNDNSIKAFFIGSGNEMPDYNEVLFQGRVKHDLLPDYLNCADVFVLPTSNEGCSNAIIEAMACGLPIISSDLPFNYDILDEDNSILVNPYDLSAIAKGINFLKQNVDIRSKMSKSSIKKSLELTLPKRAQKIIKYIQTQIK
jgi:teichuronic acid biosynthesis glycosyltransferase TuaC